MTKLRKLSLAAMAAVTSSAVSPLAAEIIRETAPLATRLERTVIVPADTRDHLLFIPAMINGRGPFRVFVDTGCSYTVVSPELAAAVNANDPPGSEADTAASNALGHLVTLPRVLLESVELGRARFEGVAAVVSSFAELALIDGNRVDGALGFSLFSEMKLALDYPGSRVVLSPDWPDGLPPLRAELAVREHGEVPFIEGRLQNRDLEIEIDTGANGGLRVSSQLADELTWKVAPRPGPLVEAIGDEGRDGIGRLTGRLTLGDLVQFEPVVLVGGRAPSIGYDLLHRFCIVFDQRHDRVRFYAKDAGAIPAPSERSVGLSLKLDAAGWRIAGVIPDSPADEAHLAVGDVVVRIEDRPATEWTRDQIHDWVESHEAMALVVKTSSGPRELRLRVWLLVS